MTPFAVQLDANQPVTLKRCPYLGSADDPETAALYPSPAGHCYRARPHEAVDLEHQEQFCLTEQHRTCPVLAQTTPGRLPKPLRRKGSYQYQYVSEMEQSRWRSALAWLLLAFLGVTVVWLGRTELGLMIAPQEPAADFFLNPTASPTVAHTLTPTLRPSPTALPRVSTLPTVPPTFTPRAADTATPSPMPSATLTPVLDGSQVVGQPAAAEVNVRTGPHLSYPIAWQVDAAAASLTITGQTADGAWLQVCCADGVGGWITREMVTISGDLAEVPIIPLPRPRLVIGAGRLNIRAGPGVNYPVLTIAEEGTEYEIIASYAEGLWWQICCVEGRSGWVIGESVTVYGEISTIPPALNIPPTPTMTPEP